MQKVSFCLTCTFITYYNFYKQEIVRIIHRREAMQAKEIRGIAKSKLQGKWGTMALTMFLYSLISAIASAILYGVGTIFFLIAGGAFLLSFTIMALNVTRDREVCVENIFLGFQDFGRSFALYVLQGIFVLLWSLLLIVPGIIKAHAYAMSYYILADDPKVSANDARKRSMTLMEGHKWELFCLRLSFIGWWLLCLLTFGILTFWVNPYVQCAEAVFYQDLIGNPHQAEGTPIHPSLL